jgi:hypothetical protein
MSSADEAVAAGQNQHGLDMILQAEGSHKGHRRLSLLQLSFGEGQDCKTGAVCV